MPQISALGMFPKNSTRLAKPILRTIVRARGKNAPAPTTVNRASVPDFLSASIAKSIPFSKITLPIKTRRNGSFGCMGLGPALGTSAGSSPMVGIKGVVIPSFLNACSVSLFDTKMMLLRLARYDRA